MKHAGLVLAIVIVLSSGAADASSPLVLSLQHELRIEETLVEGEMGQLVRERARLGEAWTRVNRGAADFLKATADGEGQESLLLRDEDIRQAEGELLMGLMEVQRLRGSLLKGAARIAATRAELELVLGRGRGVRDPLSGTWTMVWEPGGQKGLLHLILDGTLVQGTYQMEGGWTGSMRGSLVNRRVRLERIDAQLGFAAIFYGDLQLDGDVPRMVGKWEATQLASGLPSAGAWVAERIDESLEP